MNVNTEQNNEAKKKFLIDYFDGLTADYWKTVDEIAAGTKLGSGDILQIISTSGEFVRSSYRTKNGEPLFTSRKMFKNKAPFVDKLIGAFKNRID